MEPLILEPEFVLDFDAKVHSGPIVIRQGLVESIGQEPILGNRIKLKNQVIMPGFVNCHSHAFQRVLRGMVEKKTASVDHFFNWRNVMYTLAQKISPDDLEILASLAYLEMLEAGFTHVGEFHYLHHDFLGIHFKNRIVMGQKLAKAAHGVGINQCLLYCAYHRSDFKSSIRQDQRRFLSQSCEEFIALLREAQHQPQQPSTTIGAAIHSVRAVPQDWFAPIHEYASNHNMPLHVHASEQTQDVASCLENTGHSPISLLNQYGLITPQTTLVHATHLIKDDLAILHHRKPSLCLCPSTEKNLGDGMPLAGDLFVHNPFLCIGTDQHVRIDPFDEARSIEENDRLRLMKRGILGRNESYLYQTLMPFLQKNGLRSLYPASQAKLIGGPANLVVLELPPEYEWHGPHQALDAIMLAHNTHHVAHVITNGDFVVHNKEAQYGEKNYLIKNIKKIISKIFS